MRPLRGVGATAALLARRGRARTLVGVFPDHGVILKDGFCAFTREDLVAVAEKSFATSMHATSMGRLLRRLDLSRQKARASYSLKDLAAAAAFKKSPANAAENSAYA